MLKTLGSREFSAVSSKKQEQNDQYASICWELLGALTACWQKELGSQKIAILLFLVNRTLYYRKEAALVWHYQWYDGIVDKRGNPVCDGTGMSEKTLRKHLNELIDGDYLNVYRLVEAGKSVDNHPRLYEINFTKLLRPYQTEGSEMPRFSRQIGVKSAKERIESGVKGGSKNWEGGVVETTTHNNTNNRLTKVNLSAGAPRSGRVVAGTDDIVASHPILREPKQKRRAPHDESPAYVDPPEPTGRALVEMIQNRDRTARAERLKTAATRNPWELSKLELQALLDKAMKLYHPKQPRMLVTAKEHGLLRKRLKESAPKDFSDFIDWTIRSWYTISVQHRNAVMKDAERLAKARMIGACPNFQDLAYRLPYFIKCHSNYVVSKRGVEQETDEHKKQIAALKQENANLRQSVKVMRRRNAVSAAPQERAPHRDAVPERRGVRVVEDDEIDFAARFRPEDEPVMPTEFIDGSPEQYGIRRLRNVK